MEERRGGQISKGWISRQREENPSRDASGVRVNL